MPFKVTEVELRMGIQYRDDGLMEVLDPSKKVLAQAAIAACGRTNHPPNTVDPNYEFAGMLKSQQALDVLKADLRAFLADLDQIQIVPEETAKRQS